MATEATQAKILDALEAEAASHGIDVVDVEVVGATKAPTVRVRIDHADEDAPTISLDEVTAQTEWISAAVEAIDPFSGSYMLEVSSPGLARPLRRERDFERFAGEEVSMTTTATEGRKRFTGTLRGIADGIITIDCDGEECPIPLDTVKKCTIKPNFDFSGKAEKSK